MLIQRSNELQEEKKLIKQPRMKIENRSEKYEATQVEEPNTNEFQKNSMKG